MCMLSSSWIIASVSFASIILKEKYGTINIQGIILFHARVYPCRRGSYVHGRRRLKNGVIYLFFQGLNVRNYPYILNLIFFIDKSIIRPCVGLIPQPRSPTKCLWIEKSIKEGQGPIRTVEASGKKNLLLFSSSSHKFTVQKMNGTMDVLLQWFQGRFQ
jgi:hypothetical protein